VQDLKAIRFIPGTKISHDYDGKEVTTFSYRELWGRDIPAIGIPCRQNNLLIVDVDVAGATHQNDGREYWANFCREFGVPPTYTVRSPSGGFHFYFKLPEAVNPDTFAPPSGLAPGVDLKWNGWVGAPPTDGYEVYWGDLTLVQDVPPGLMAEIARLKQGTPSKTFDVSNPGAVLDLHTPYSDKQIHDLRERIGWVQQHGSLSRSEWRDGLFALKAGIEDPSLLDEFALMWTMNKSYVPGDEEQARSIVERADRFGPIGPGSIFSIINQIYLRQGAPMVETPFTRSEILDRSQVQTSINKDGSLRIETSESNAAALIGAIFDEKTLYHDLRSDHYMYKGRPASDGELIAQFLPMLQSPAFGMGLEKFRRATIAGGLDVLMATRRRDPHQEYLKGLAWDGVPRLESFFERYIGTPDSAYLRLLGVNLWTALAARGLSPGCKFDSIFILEGDEGIHKSSLIEAIAGDYTFAPSKRDFANDLDILRQMHQSVITELPELIGIIGQDSNFVKAFLAKPFDNIRGLWEKRAAKRERGFIMIGTTNQPKYLALDMGSRRFWPVKIPQGAVINLAGIKSDRDQLFAEGIARYRDGHQYWYMPKDLLAPEVGAKVIADPLAGPIHEIVEGMGREFTTTDVYKRLEAGGFIGRGMTASLISRVELILEKMGCESAGAMLWVYRPQVMGQMVQVMAAYANQMRGGLAAFI
jgi:hypothetical protein